MRFFIVGIISLFISCSTQYKRVDKEIIPIGTIIGTGAILNLSDYAESVTYIPLETNDFSLIGEIYSFKRLDDKYVILDSWYQGNGKCLLFDKQGSFIREMGKKGQGPEEYVTISSIDVNHISNHVLISDRRKLLEYDSIGNLKKTVQTPKCPADNYCWETFQMNDSTYLSTLVSPMYRLYKAILFGKNGNTIKLYPNYYQQEKIGIEKNGFGSTDGKIYRYKDQIRYWRSWDDTVFTFDRNQDIQIAYRFDLGKYRAPIEWMSSYREDYDITNYVYPQSIKESDRYLFLSFACGRNAPEKFEYVQEGTTPMGRQKQSLVNVSVYGLFDKQTSDFVLLNQPIKHKELGFRNDLDGGPVFWPKYISPDEKMITWWSADQFLEIYESLPNPSTELREVAENLKPDDNPVLMVVQLK